MTHALLALLLFALWTLLLLLGGVVAPRVVLTLSGKVPSNGFGRPDYQPAPLEERLHRAHLNCTENLPVFGAIVLVGHLVGLGDGGFGTLAMVYLGGRLGQSTTHIISTSVMAVNVRFTFLMVQIVSAIWMGALALMA